jgi:hypothetical protein
LWYVDGDLQTFVPGSPSNYPTTTATGNATSPLANDYLFLVTRGAISNFSPASIASLRVYGTKLTDTQVSTNAALDAEKTTMATPKVTFGGVGATNVEVIDQTTLRCVTPAHSAGAVDVVVSTSASRSAKLSAAYRYQASRTMEYGGVDCSSCHSGNVHKEHTRSTCETCHKERFNPASLFEVTDWSQALGSDLLPPRPNERSCGVDSVDCHQSGTRRWHGDRAKDLHDSHSSAKGSDTYVSCSGGTSGFACHSQGSGDSPFFFAPLDIAQAHSDYAFAQKEGRVNPAAKQSALEDGCGLCHSETGTDPARLKPFARKAKDDFGSNLTCTSCHSDTTATYVSASAYPAAMATALGNKSVCYMTPYGSETTGASSVSPPSQETSGPAPAALSDIVKDLDAETKSSLGISSDTTPSMLEAEEADPTLQASELLHAWLPTSFPKEGIEK